ncbi:MAG: hypothetical protein C0599_02690 [Salinivirgaceae bacterium]|nr:MAG: hypothetical protein C0599_02690 [Salinivirgaceae bacterium]
MHLNHMFRIIIGIVLFGILNQSHAQTYDIGEWIEHFSKRDVVLMDESGGVIYAATHSSVFMYDIESGEYTTKTTAEGLSDINITAIKYNETYNFLMVGYASGLIDFVYDNDVFTIVDIQQNSSLTSKVVNNIHYSGDTAYVACDFGLLLINIPQKEIKSTYFLGTSQQSVVVKDVTIGFDSVWVATDQGIFVAPERGTNLYNYQNWSTVDILPDYEYNFVEKIGSSIYCAASETDRDHIYIYSNGQYEEFAPNNEFRSTRLDKRGDYFTMIASYRIWFLNDNEQFVEDLYFTGYNNNWIVPNDGFIYNDVVYFADKVSGIIKLYDEEELAFSPNSPFANTINQITSNQGVTYVTGGIPGAKYNAYGMYIYDGYWINLNSKTNSALSSIPNINYIAFERGNNSKMYATSYGYGFLVFEDTTLTDFYNADNSTLQNIAGYPDVYIITTGLQADDNMGAWVTLSGVPEPINYYDGSGEWMSFDLNSEITNSTLRELEKMPWGHMWCVEEGSGIVVFDPEMLKAGQITNAYNRFSVKSSDGSGLTTVVTAMAVDHDGYVWFGMDEGGLAVYYNASSALDNDITASKIIVEQGGIAQYLLENERVSSIAIDGGNRKWIGTETGGAFLISEDGTEQIFNLNTSNSPLPTNFIRDIEVDQVNGIVYIGTDEGLLGYYTGVKESASSVDELKIYPNPVYENYNDLVRIEGLQDEMKLKITDVGGQIVFETTATGGTAYWNMRDFYNARVSTGVYLFYASSADGSQTASGKVFVVSP